VRNIEEHIASSSTYTDTELVALNCTSATPGSVSTNLSQCNIVMIRGSNTVTVQNPNSKSKLYWTTPIWVFLKNVLDDNYLYMIEYD